MVTTVREKLAEIADSCRDALKDLSELEEAPARDLQAIDSILRRLEGSQGNQPLTGEDAHAMALVVKRAVEGNRLSVQLSRVLMLLVFEVSVLAQQQADTPLDAPASAEGPLTEWSKQWKAAKESWDEYTQ